MAFLSLEGIPDSVAHSFGKYDSACRKTGSVPDFRFEAHSPSNLSKVTELGRYQASVLLSVEWEQLYLSFPGF